MRKKIPHAVPGWVADGSWFFITVNAARRGTNHFCHPGVGDAVLAAMQFNHEKLIWHCRLCLLMPDHLHAILAFAPAPGMVQAITQWKKYLSAKQGVRWQRDFFDHRLRDRHELEEKASYILLNPVRRGLCERVEDWRWVYQPNDRLPPHLG